MLKFKEKTQEEWCSIMEGTDICFAPVLSMEDAINHEHNQSRDSFINIEGVDQPAPAPKFSETISEVSHPPLKIGESTKEIMSLIGLDSEIDLYLKENIISEG